MDDISVAMFTVADQDAAIAYGIDLDPEPMQTPGAPMLFMVRDPDGNSIAVVQPS